MSISFFRICLLIAIVFAPLFVQSACKNIPLESTVTYPSSGTTFPSTGSLTSSSSPATNYLVNSNTSYTVNVSGGSAAVTIYITNNSTLTINGDFNAGSATIYVQLGSTLKITGNYNGGTSYVYGTLATSGVSLQNNTSNIYIAGTGFWNASSASLNMSGGTAVVEGTAIINNLNQLQNSGTAFCVNKSGCVQFNSITAAAPSLSNAFISDNGVGTIYWNNTTCPTGNAGGYTLSATPALKVCSAQPSGPCTFWGSATVKFNCIPVSPNNNCAGAIALPIRLVYFDATLVEKKVLLKWATAFQTNSAYFVVEESVDGRTWKEVGRQNANGTSIDYSEYSMWDNSPLPGNNYYRLKEISNSGEETVYSVRLVTISMEDLTFLLYPNPSTGKLTVALGNTFDKYSVDIFDMRGSLIASYTFFPGDNTFSLQTPGVYVAKLKVGHELITEKFVIQ